MRSAQADSSPALRGRHTNSLRRLGVSPAPVALNGPLMVTDATEGRAPRLRPGGRSAASDNASLRCRKATSTLRGPAGTAKRNEPWFGGSSPAAAPAPGTPGRLDTFVIALRSPSMLISS
jgi:hypothetical protein